MTRSSNIFRRGSGIRRTLLCALALSPVLAALYVGVFWIRFDGVLHAAELRTLRSTIVIAAAAKLVALAWFRVLRGWNRYVTFQDFVALVQSVSAASVVLAVADYLFLPLVTVPRSIFLMDWLSAVVVMAALRSARRFFTEVRLRFSDDDGTERAFIVGVSEAGEALLRVIRSSRSLRYRVVGFIDSSPQPKETCIAGVPVLGGLTDVHALAERRRVTSLLIAADKVSGRDVRRLLEEAGERGMTVKMLPSYKQLIEGHLAVKPRDVAIDDLLRREPVELDTDGIHRWMDGRTILVTGSAGSIGSEICRQLLSFRPKKLVLVDRAETGQFFLERQLRAICPHVEIELLLADICDAPRMMHIFSRHRPEIVFHAAAYKHVPLVEDNPGEGVKNTIMATKLLADLADRAGVASFVMISTDKAVNPTSVMGCCKRVAELYVQSRSAKSDTRFVTVRFGNVLDSAGSVVPIFREQIAGGGPVTVTHPEMQRYFMTIPEASQLVIQAGMMGGGGEIFVLDMGEPVRIVDLARDMVRLSGLREGRDIEVTFSGIRPGEKLFEELVLDGEEHGVTPHPKVMVVQGRPQCDEQLSRRIEHLVRAADGPAEEIIAELQRLVPSFQREAPAEPQPVRHAA